MPGNRYKVYYDIWPPPPQELMVSWKDKGVGESVKEFNQGCERGAPGTDSTHVKGTSSRMRRYGKASWKT